MASASLLNRYEESIGSTANVSAESASVIMSTVAVHGILTAEVALLASSSKRTFHDVADQNLAAAGDRQGIGGSYEDDSNVTPISRA